MANILSEVDDQIHEKGLADGPSNPMSQHAYDGFAKSQSRSGSGSGLALGAVAVGLVLVLASICGLWILSSVRRLNRQVAHLNRQTEQFNRRLQTAEHQAKALEEKLSQAVATQIAAPRPDQAKQPEAASAAQTQAPVPSKAAAQPVNQAADKAEEPAANKAEESRKQRDAALQKLQQSFGQIAETHRTAAGLVMTLGEKSLRFAADKSDVAPQYRAVLNRIAGVLKPVQGYSIYVYGYTDENGTTDYNLKLSARRARAVRDALVKAGIDANLISTKGFGKSKPRVRGSNAQARAANRRVEIGIADSSLPSRDQLVSRK